MRIDRNSARIWGTLRLVLLLALPLTLIASIPFVTGWHAYDVLGDALVPLALSPHLALPLRRARPASLCMHLDLPGTWQIRDAFYDNLSGGQTPECVLLVWRPWEDWPIMRWSDTPSPIAGNRNAAGDSAHIILAEPLSLEEVQRWGRSYRERWAGSALAVPILRIAVGDVGGDGGNELVALEGDYAAGRDAPAYQVAVWRWNGFGFSLVDRQKSDAPLRELRLADLDGDGEAEILVR